MTYTEWLRSQVSRLEGEIRSHPVFETGSTATRAELADIRQTIVLHTYLRQQLLRRDGVSVSDQADAQQEFVLVPVPVSAYRL